MRHSLPDALCRVMRLGLGLLLLAALPAITVHAATPYYVGTAADDTGTNTVHCATQSNTDCTLRDALAAATSGSDTITFGTAFPSGAQTITIATNGTLTIAHSVTLTGPANQTVAIDGGYNPMTQMGGVRIFDVTGATTFTVNNLTIQHGNAPDDGGGVRVASASTLVATHCTFTANAASARGGAIYGDAVLATGTGGTVTVADSIFTSNTVLGGTANDGGGAIYILNGLLSVTNSAFTGNTAPGNNNGNDPEGGAIHIQESDRTVSAPAITITGGSFANNNAADGGAISDDSGLLIVTNVAFTGNTASGDTSAGPGSPNGGAIVQGAGTLTLTGGRFATNSANPTLAGSGGGIALVPGGSLNEVPATGNVMGTTFTSNTAGQGGAIYGFSRSMLTVSQSAFATNTANGGAIYQQQGTTTVVASTFTGNTSNGGLGGTFTSLNTSGQTSTATIINSTFTGNDAGPGEGGAVLSDNATTTTIINSTLYANTALGGLGGNIYQFHTCCNPSPPSGAGTVTLINALIGGSAATGGDLATNAVSPSAVFLGHNNLIDDTASAGPFHNGTNGNKVGVAAGVGSLGSNGGPTQTIPLLTGSAAIGAADPAVCAAATPNGAGGIDQRDIGRPANQCSIGAFEPQPKPNPVPVPRPHGSPVSGGPPAPLPPLRPPMPPVPNGSPAPVPVRRP